MPGLRLMGKGWMLAAPQLFLQGLQPQVSAYLGPGGVVIVPVTGNPGAVSCASCAGSRGCGG